MKNKNKQEPKTLPGKVWNFLWNDDSLLSWIVSLALAFIIVKFIFFPLLSLVFASSLPLVVVESGSMHHPGSFIGNTISLQDNFLLWWNEKGNWYEDKNITEQQAEAWPFKTGLEIGDIVVVSGRGKIKLGDIIIFNADQKHPLIHRVISIKNIDGKIFYSTKGDNNQGQLSSEQNISEEQVLGKALFKVPKLGWIKLAFVKIIQAL